MVSRVTLTRKGRRWKVILHGRDRQWLRRVTGQPHIYPRVSVRLSRAEIAAHVAKQFPGAEIV